MLLYDAAWAPSPRRVRVFLHEKGVTLPVETVDLRGGAHMSPDYLAVNPRGMLPALRLDDGTLLDESSAICRYVEARWPEPPLLGRDAGETGAIDGWLRRIEHDLYGTVVHVFRNTSPAFADRPVPGNWPAMAQLPEMAARGRAMWAAALDELDAHLAGRDWIVRDRYSAADIWALIAVDFGRAAKLEVGARPNVARWHAAATARPSAAA